VPIPQLFPIFQALPQHRVGAWPWQCLTLAGSPNRAMTMQRLRLSEACLQFEFFDEWTTLRNHCAKD